MCVYIIKASSLLYILNKDILALFLLLYLKLKLLSEREYITKFKLRLLTKAEEERKGKCTTGPLSAI
jgi:hypothetical protein